MHKLTCALLMLLEGGKVNNEMKVSIQKLDFDPSDTNTIASFPMVEIKERGQPSEPTSQWSPPLAPPVLRPCAHVVSSRPTATIAPTITTSYISFHLAAWRCTPLLARPLSTQVWNYRPRSWSSPFYKGKYDFTIKGFRPIYQWLYLPDPSGEATVGVYCFGSKGCKLSFREIGIYNYEHNVCGYQGEFSNHMIEEYEMHHSAPITEAIYFYIAPMALVAAVMAGILRVWRNGRAAPNLLF